MIFGKVNHIRGNSRRNVLAAATTGFSDFLLKNGGNAAKVFGSVGLDGEELHDINHPLDLGCYVRMMELAAANTGNDNFGLWYGQQFKPEMLGLIGGIAIASSTLGAAMSNLARLFPYHQQATHTAFGRRSGSVSFEYRIIDGGILERRHDAELTLGMVVNVVRHSLGSQWAPEAVHFEHPRPADYREHEHAFLAPAHFGQRTNALIFRDERLSQRMPQGDLQKATTLSDELVRISGGIGTLSLLDHVKGEIRSCLPSGIPYIEDIANAVGLPRWTLQRRLMEYGLSFSGVIELVRRELAVQHIRQHYVSVLEVSALLGYSESSAFSRAFRRWFGVSPQKYRSTQPAIDHAGR